MLQWHPSCNLLNNCKCRPGGAVRVWDGGFPVRVQAAAVGMGFLGRFWLAASRTAVDHAGVVGHSSGWHSGRQRGTGRSRHEQLGCEWRQHVQYPGAWAWGVSEFEGEQRTSFHAVAARTT
jgi:hypothetical protein